MPTIDGGDRATLAGMLISEAELVAPKPSQPHAVDTSRGLQGQEGDLQVQPEVTPKYSVQQLRDAFNLAAKEYEDDHNSREKRRAYKKALTALLGQVDKQLRASGVDPTKVDHTAVYADNITDLLALRNDIIVAQDNIKLDRQEHQEKIQRGLTVTEVRKLTDAIKTRLYVFDNLGEQFGNLLEPGLSKNEAGLVTFFQRQCSDARERTEVLIRLLVDMSDLALSQVVSFDQIEAGDLSAITTYINRDPQVRSVAFAELLRIGTNFLTMLSTGTQATERQSALQKKLLSAIDQFSSADKDLKNLLQPWILSGK